MDIQKAIRYLRGIKIAFAAENEAPLAQKALDLAIEIMEKEEWKDAVKDPPIDQDEYIVEKDGFVFSAEYFPGPKIWVGKYTDVINGVTRWRRMPDPWEETEGQNV